MSQDTKIHPAAENLLKFFRHDHLPEHLQEVSKQCHDLAHQMIEHCASSAELTAGLRKLLEAKDCFVRARLEKWENAM